LLLKLHKNFGSKGATHNHETTARERGTS
jgi:hypothetical protein